MPSSNFKDSVVRNLMLAGLCFGFSCFCPWPAPNELKNWSTLSSYHGLKWLRHIHKQDKVGDMWGHKFRSFPAWFFLFCSAEGRSLFWRTEREMTPPQSRRTCRKRSDLLPFVLMINSKSPKKCGCFPPTCNKIKPLSGDLLLNSTLIKNIWS